MDSDGSIIEETKYNNTLDQAESFASSIKRKHGAGESTITAVCESTGNLWLKTYQAFEKYNIDVKLANPLKTKAIAEARIKTDKLDAKTLAHLLRSDLVAECYIASKKTTQAIKLFSELKTPVEVAIELDLPADQVQAIYREYWELEGMYGLVQIYEEGNHDLHGLLRLHRIVKDLGMEKQDIINVFDFVKHNQLRTLQWKAAYLRYQINMLETEKTEAMNHLFKLKRRIHESQETLAQKRADARHISS